MSVGINLIMDLLKKCAAVLGDGYDVEITEKHHNQKLDAPSGTALMLADAVSEALPYDADYVYDRHERREKRPAHEIGIHTVRGGTIVGEHTVLFAGRDELIEIKHTALSREVFAAGAVDAAAYLAAQTQPGLYNMGHVIASK
jgi:4-hydroxy-tetrahydrodipicolinate reductase